MVGGKGDGIKGGPISVDWGSEADGRAVVLISGDLTIGTVEASHGIVSEVLGRATSVAIKCDGLRMIDLAGIQLLMAGRRCAERVGKLFYLVSPADGALREALIIAGLFIDGDSSGETGWVDAFWLAD